MIPMRSTKTARKKYQVFVSSTSKDLKDHRAKVLSALQGRDLIPVGMEQFSSSGTPQEQYIRQQLQDSDLVVLILAGRYGDPVGRLKNMSYTEYEYRMAKSLGKPVIPFICKLDNIPNSQVDQQYLGCGKENEKRTRLDSLRAELLHEVNLNEWNYNDIAGLATMARKAVDELISGVDAPTRRHTSADDGDDAVGNANGLQNQIGALRKEIDDLREQNKELSRHAAELEKANKELNGKLKIETAQNVGTGRKLIAVQPRTKPQFNINEASLLSIHLLPVVIDGANGSPIAHTVSCNLKESIIFRLLTDSLTTSPGDERNIREVFCASFVKRLGYDGSVHVTDRCWNRIKDKFNEKNLIEESLAANGARVSLALTEKGEDTRDWLEGSDPRRNYMDSDLLDAFS
ncbi:DUF4062 domain-containing protein [Bifidobacterium sp. ESL0798]|uniref:DUF4062 domain-containing protein n=1 Tax=Bifidobacterium sp. ESL0798 TaxID=2983235 RepID=UPI0023F6DED7|nr:DUF4062 domain-containing protein [Bifidobacterium sp. ESL0798]WEV74241.1 DUF4062 domain-containing protein [Bifidobacterium sp. ESL0798]